MQRLKESRSFDNINVANNVWNSAGTYNQMYYNAFEYDANGNINRQVRHAQDGNVVIDDMTYKYLDEGGKRKRNRLYHVDENINDALGGIQDMGAFDAANIEHGNNYEYDAEGRLIQDKSEGIENIVWRVDGKIREITRDNGSNRSVLRFDYDAMGNRIAKHVINNQTQLPEKTTYYLLDAQGNTMNVYEYTIANNTTSFKLEEQHIYGSSRIGMVQVEHSLTSSVTSSTQKFIEGDRLFELSNHLGNVLSVVKDKRFPLVNGGGNVGSYEAYIVASTDYSPFGVPLDGRTFSSSEYRYGFQGSEKDDEVKGAGNSYTTEFRQYDPRLGRWLTLDPKMSDYPSISPFAYANNSPLMLVDEDGGSPISIFAKMIAKKGLKTAAKEAVEAMIKKRLSSYMSKSWAKQLGKDAIDAIDLATSTSWWEYVVEFVPVVGDVYGIAILGKQGHHVWKIVNKFERIGEFASKAAGKAWKKLGDNVLSGKGASLITEYTKKFNNQGTHLGESDLAGAVKEIYGLKSGSKAGGVAYQHLKEVKEALSGMEYQIKKLRSDISSGAFEGDALKAAQGILKDTVKQYEGIQNTFKGARKSAEKYKTLE